MDSRTRTRFDAEYRNVFASGLDSLFQPPGLDAITADYESYPLAELAGLGRVAVGIDWAGTGADSNTLVAEAPIPGSNVHMVVCVERRPPGFQPHEFVEQIASSPAALGYVAAETNGLGQALAGADVRAGNFHGLLWRRLRERPLEVGGGKPPRRYVLLEERPWDANGRLVDAFTGRPFKPRRRPGFVTIKQPIHRTPEEKAATYSALRLLIDQQRIVIPAAAEDLRRELLMLRVDLSPSGTEKVEASSGHDDLADALSLSLIPHRAASGQWRTLIGELADPARSLPPPDPPLPADVQTVRTPAGLGVPIGPDRRPIFQAVNGSEVTGVEAPASDDPRDPRTHVKGPYGDVWMRRVPATLNPNP
jgi:hypothetical protein